MKKKKMKLFNLKKSLITGLLVSGVVISLFAGEKRGAEQQDTEAKIKFTIPKTKGVANNASGEPTDGSLNLVHVPNLNFEYITNIQSLITESIKGEFVPAAKDDVLKLSDNNLIKNHVHYVHVNDVRYTDKNKMGQAPGWQLVVKMIQPFKSTINNEKLDGLKIVFQTTKKSSGEIGLESTKIDIDNDGTKGQLDYAIHGILSSKKEEFISDSEILVLKADKDSGRFNTLGYFEDENGNSTFKLLLSAFSIKNANMKEYKATLQWTLKDVP
jgi:hypothetical protein